MPDSLSYRVAELSCDHCTHAVSEALRRVAGVRTVAVDLDTKLVRVDGSGIDPGAAVTAIDEAGYAAEPA